MNSLSEVRQGQMQKTIHVTDTVSTQYGCKSEIIQSYLKNKQTLFFPTGIMNRVNMFIHMVYMFSKT